MSKPPKYRHAQAETLAGFFKRTGQPTPEESLADLDEIALQTQDKEALAIFEAMVGRATDRWWDNKLAEFKGQIPVYLAVFMIFACVSIILYFTRTRT